LTSHPSAPTSTPLNSSLMAAIGTEEIDAALDAFRIDLEKEVNLREEKRAQEIEEGLLLKEETILEFESAHHATSSEQPVQTQAISTDSFELDEIGLELQPVNEQIPSQVPDPPPSLSESEELKKENKGLPSFGATKPEGFHYWIPLTLLVVVLFFMLFILR
jgi:hypothetical protein